MIKFAYTDYFYYLISIPILIVLFVGVMRQKKRQLRRFGDLSILNDLMPYVSVSRSVIKFVLILLVIVFAILAMASPQFGSKLKEVKRKGVEIIIALDVSNSMLAEDITPNRLEKAKMSISKLVDKLKNDKIGLIVFAGDAYVQVPITTDYRATKMFLSTAKTNIVPKQGTAIGSAIELAMTSFSPEEDKSKVIIIITDGENHEDDAVEMANGAVKKGITVHAIGMGLSQGAPIPERNPYGQKEYRKDKDGNVIISKLNENMLQQLAASGNGIYVRATNAQTGLDVIFDEINKMEKHEIEANIFADYEEQFQYPLMVALFFLLIEMLVRERKNKFFERINPF